MTRLSTLGQGARSIAKVQTGCIYVTLAKTYAKLVIAVEARTRREAGDIY